METTKSPNPPKSVWDNIEVDSCMIIRIRWKFCVMMLGAFLTAAMIVTKKAYPGKIPGITGDDEALIHIPLFATLFALFCHSMYEFILIRDKHRDANVIALWNREQEAKKQAALAKAGERAGAVAMEHEVTGFVQSAARDLPATFKDLPGQLPSILTMTGCALIIAGDLMYLLPRAPYDTYLHPVGYSMIFTGAAEFIIAVALTARFFESKHQLGTPMSMQCCNGRHEMKRVALAAFAGMSILLTGMLLFLRQFYTRDDSVATIAMGYCFIPLQCFLVVCLVWSSQGLNDVRVAKEKKGTGTTDWAVHPDVVVTIETIGILGILSSITSMILWSLLNDRPSLFSENTNWLITNCAFGATLLGAGCFAFWFVRGNRFFREGEDTGKYSVLAGATADPTSQRIGNEV